MKNFKRILAIVLVVMMVVPMMTTGLSAATAETLQGQYSAGVTFAGGNWKAYSYNDWSKHMGEALAAFDDLANVNVDAEGQIVLSNQIQYGFNSYQQYGWVNQNVMNVLQSTNTTAIDGLFFRNGMMAQASGSTVFAESLSYAFSENQLLGTLSTDVYTKEEGFAVEGGMVTDGLVISMYNNDNDIMSNGSVFNVITAYVMDGGKIVSSQSFETEAFGKDFGLCTGHAHNTYISFVDGVVTFHVEDNYSANGAYFNQTYTFDELDTATISTNKDYYFCVGSKGEGADGVDGSVNINLARIGTFTIDAATGLYDTADSENKNIADWTGHGTVSCAHEVWSDWTETLAPSCTTTGIEERTCLGCGKVEVNTIAALGHSYSDWNTDVMPDCVNAGSKSRVCSVCGDVDTEVIAANGHAWGDWYNTVDPECEYVGLKQRDCSVCGAYEEEVIPALGHDWVWDTLPTYDVNGQRTCATCGTVEADLAYDLSYYWITACDNKVGNIDAAYADYNDEYLAEVVDGAVSVQDMSLVYGGEYNYNTVLKATSKFATDLEGFYATIEIGNGDGMLAYDYPTTISFIWTNIPENYDDAAEYSVYNPGAVGLSNKLQASRYGHIYNNYLAGEYTFCAVLADTSFIYSEYDYGTPNDGMYDWLYSTVVSNGNYWTTKMDTIAVPADEAITVGLLYEFDPTDSARDMVAYVDINGELYCPGVGANHQLTTQDYYFGVATFAYGTNHSASFKITDVCGQDAALFNGWTHECYTEHFEEAATCTEDGYSADICLACNTEYNKVVTPATGHDFVDYVCQNCGLAQAAKVNDEGFNTLQEAIDAAEDGDTITLLAGVSGKVTYTFNKNVNLDLNGKTLRHTSGNPVVVDGATVTVVGTSGTIRSSDGISVTVVNGGSFVINVATTVRCSSEEGFNVFAVEDGSSVVINALGGRYYKNPANVAGVVFGDHLTVQENSSTNYSIVKYYDWKITFDTVGGTMPEGVPTEMGINTNENYKEATGFDYPVPTLEGYVFEAWYWDVYNYMLYPGDWNNGYFAVAQDVALEAIWNECTHTWGDWVEDEAAGTKSRTCDVCGLTETETLECAHNYVVTDVVAPTCTEAGYSVYTCEFCGDSYNADPVDAEGHQYEAFVTAPTCTEAGYTTYTCGICGDSYVADETEAAGHAWGEWFVTIKPTYYEVGEETRVCDTCGEFETREVAKKSYLITFDTCGGTMPEGVPTELGINYQENYKEAAGFDYPIPTYDEGGYVFDCWYWSEYNYWLTEGDWNGGYFAITWNITLEAVWVECPGHEWTEEIVSDPTYIEEGLKVKTCTVCGLVEEEAIPVIVPPYTITFDTMGGTMPEGVKTVYGIDNGDNYKEATGIEYPIPTYDEGGYVFDCWYWPEYNFWLTPGDWNGGYYAITWSITVEAVWVECPGHEWTEWVVDEAAGVQTRTCTVCNLVETEDYVPAVELNVTANANVISVVGLTSDVKDVFISKGAWETYAQMKPNKIYCITPNHKSVVDGAFDYTVAEDGTYTVMVRFTDGTMEARVFVVDCAAESDSDLVVDGNTVTVKNLENLLVLRYAKGEYETSYEIKRAPGVTNIAYYSKKIVDNTFTVDLEPGTYTFVTQFKDGVFNYYTVVIEEPVVVEPKDWVLSFDTVGGDMPEGFATEYGINTGDYYKDVLPGYPVPTLDGYVFDGWLLNKYNFWFTEGDYNSGYYAVSEDCVFEAMWLEA